MNELQKPTVPRDCVRRVLGLVEQKAPRSILVVGVDGSELFAAYLHGRKDCTLTCLGAQCALQRLPPCGRHDFGFVADTLEHLPKPEGAALIAAMRDLHAERFCVVVATGKGSGPRGGQAWEDTELLALGLSRLARYEEEEGRRLSLYGFDIASYKQTPDWLNPRYWAHPELWDKYRW